MTYHQRLAFDLRATLVTPLIAWLMLDSKHTGRPAFKVVLGAVSDLCNAFAGRHLHGVWHTNTVASTDFPFSHSILFIVDPNSTVPLIAFVGAFIFKPDRAMRVTTVALVFSTGYWWSSAAKLSIDAKVAAFMWHRA